VNVVWHQAVAQHGQFVKQGILPEQGEIDVAVAGGAKHGLAGIAALGDMMGKAASDHPSQARHIERVAGGPELSQKPGNVPSVPRKTQENPQENPGKMRKRSVCPQENPRKKSQEKI
jgi:hypothetical protein